MANTLFNIFGSHQDGPIQKQTFNSNMGENAIAVKKLGAIPKGITPSKINKNINSPKLNSIKKKTFLQNEGASIQAFRPYSAQNTMATPAFKKNLQIYEDPKYLNKFEDEIIKMEYNRKPIIDESDDEFEIKQDQIDKLVFGLPTNCTPISKLESPRMIISTENNTDFDDLFVDCEPDFEDNELDIDNF